MTDREKAIVMAYTGICTLQGDKLNEFYKYLADLYGRPVYTHEIVDLDIAEKSKADFVRICHDEQPERKKGKWINIRNDNIAECDQCGITGRAWMNFCFDCGADMRGDAEAPKKCDTCRHVKSQWFNRCADCFDYELWESKE